MDPITLGIGAALAGGGMLANMFGSNANERARRQVTDNQNMAQALLDAQARGVNAHSLGLYSNFQPGMEARGKELGDYFAGAAAPTTSAPTAANTTNMPASTSAPTQMAETVANTKGQAAADQGARSLAGVRSFGDYLGDITRQQGRDAATLAMIQSAQRGDANLEGIQLDAAGHAGDAYNTAGSILSGLGRIGITGGIGGTLHAGSWPGQIAGMFGNGVMTPAQQLAAGVIPV